MIVACVPVKAGVLDSAVTFVMCMPLSNVGIVTAVGTFAVKLPAAHASTNSSFCASYVAVSVGSVHAAAVPGDTAPPDAALVG